MRKRIIGVMFLAFLVSSTTYAHVSGSFGDFLQGVKDESTTEKLKDEINQTKEEIERLTPQIERMGTEYNQRAEQAVAKLKFYSSIGLDTYMNFIWQSGDIVDILANERLVEKKIQSDLQDLDQLYLQYMPLKLAKDSLEGHVELLDMIRGNLQAREAFLATRKDLTPEELASIMVIIWVAKTSNLDEILQKDSELINQNIHELVTRKTPESPYRLEEALINRQSELTYYFRSDHIYAQYHNQDANVILIGQMYKTNGKTASLRFESGFLNGIQLSSDLLEELPGFQLYYANLNPDSKGFYVEQMNGAITILPAENAAE